MKITNRFNNNSIIKTFSEQETYHDALQNTTDKKIFVNQLGYDSDKSKRATVTNIGDGEMFIVKRVGDNKGVAYGFIKNSIADFSHYKDDSNYNYYIECDGVKSHNFKVKKNLIFDISAPSAVKFMEMSRQDKFDRGGSSGVAWRDSHQFSFELNSLALMYMANPSYYKNQPRDVYKITECDYSELTTQNEPNIIWLIKYGVYRYYDLVANKNTKLHALIKGQLAYFLYLYPYITNYVTQEFYEQIRDFTIAQWSVETCSQTWYDTEDFYLIGTEINHNLFTTQNVIGNVKGVVPPGYAIMPNYLMWEVAKRDSLDTTITQQFKTALDNNLNWLVNDVDLDDPRYTKGQRMSEYITMTSLTYVYESNPYICPTGTYEKIERWADVMISRSKNLWDYRQYSTVGDVTNSESTRWVNLETSGGLCNQPGGVAGFAGCCFSVSRVITDANKKERLKKMAMSHIDHVFGRNPHNKHFCYTASEDFEGVENNWFSRHEGGLGNLNYVIGVLDGSPKEESYPYKPDANSGYTEGWVAFNTAWNTALAYLSAESSTDGIGIFSK